MHESQREQFATLTLNTAVALTAAGLQFRLNRRTLVGAGIASGIMGTATAIGGPPMAVVYQHEGGPRARGTLAAFFTVGAVISAIGPWRTPPPTPPS